MEKYGTYQVYKNLESGEIVRIRPGQELEKISSSKKETLEELNFDPEDENGAGVHQPR